MSDGTDFAPYYDEDEGFDPNATANPDEIECVRLVEEAAKLQGRDVNFADALIALEKLARRSDPNSSHP